MAVQLSNPLDKDHRILTPGALILIKKLALRLVEIQDSSFGLVVIQALDGTIRADGRPMGEDGTALSG